MLHQQPQQIDVARLRGAHKRRSAAFKEPLHGKDGARQRIVLRARIRIAAVIEKKLDVLQVIEIRFWHRKIPTLDIAVISSQVQRSPVALIREIHIGAALDEIFAKPVMPIVSRGQQRRPAVLGNLVDVRAFIEQQLRRFEIALPRRDHKRC